MNPTTIKILRILFALFCLVFGVDKFLEFLPTCNLNQQIPPIGMQFTGIFQIIIGILLLLNKWVLLALRIVTAIIIGGLLMHLFIGQYDLTGALFGSMLGLLLIFNYKKGYRLAKEIRSQTEK